MSLQKIAFLSFRHLASLDVIKSAADPEGGEGGSSPGKILNSLIFLKLKSLGFA